MAKSNSEKAFDQVVQSFKKLNANGSVESDEFIKAIENLVWDYNELSISNFDKKYQTK
jgi:hypothetical protein